MMRAVLPATDDAALPLVAAESLPPELLGPLAPAFEEVLEYSQSHYSLISPAERRPLTARLRSLLGQIRPSDSGFPASLLHTGDEFGPTARRQLAQALSDAGIAELLLHCAALGKVEPTRRWRTEAGSLMASAPRGIHAVRALLELHSRQQERRLVERIGEYEAIVEVVADKARLTFARGGKPLKGVPAVVREADGDRLRHLRHLVKEVGKTLAAERQRVESLLSDEREWTYAD